MSELEARYARGQATRRMCGDGTSTSAGSAPMVSGTGLGVCLSTCRTRPRWLRGTRLSPPAVRRVLRAALSRGEDEHGLYRISP